MANAELDGAALAPPHKPRLAGLIISLIIAAILGGGSYYAISSGILLSGIGQRGDHSPTILPNGAEIAFIPIQPIVVSLPPRSKSRHLKFEAQLEVDKANVANVTMLLPRIVDVLNGYLRAIEPSEIETPGSLIRLRAQMLRRAQIVTGEGQVRDLLIMEFVLN